VFRLIIDNEYIILCFYRSKKIAPTFFKNYLQQLVQPVIIRFAKKYDFQGLNQMELWCDLDVDTSKKTHWDRLEVAQKVVDIKAILQKTNNKSNNW